MFDFSKAIFEGNFSFCFGITDSSAFFNYQSQVNVHNLNFFQQKFVMKLISVIFLFQLAQSRMAMNLDELTNHFSHQELLDIREKYCQSIKLSGKNSEFCSPLNDDLPERPDWMPPGWILLVLSIVRECFQTCDYNDVGDIGMNDVVDNRSFVL